MGSWPDGLDCEWYVSAMSWETRDLGSEIVPGCQRCRFRFDRAICPEACDFAHGEHVANIIEDRLIFKKFQGFSRGFSRFLDPIWCGHFSCLSLRVWRAKPIRSLRSQERDSSLGAPTGGNIQWLGFQNPWGSLEILLWDNWDAHNHNMSPVFVFQLRTTRSPDHVVALDWTMLKRRRSERVGGAAAEFSCPSHVMAGVGPCQAGYPPGLPLPRYSRPPGLPSPPNRMMQASPVPSWSFLLQNDVGSCQEPPGLNPMVSFDVPPGHHRHWELPQLWRFSHLVRRFPSHGWFRKGIWIYEVPAKIWHECYLFSLISKWSWANSFQVSIWVSSRENSTWVRVPRVPRTETNAGFEDLGEFWPIRSFGSPGDQRPRQVWLWMLHR